MLKLFFLAIAIVSYVPLEVFSVEKLQTVADVVKNSNTIRLCDYDCKPEVTIDGTNLTVSFQTEIVDGVDTSKLFGIVRKKKISEFLIQS